MATPPGGMRTVAADFDVIIVGARVAGSVLGTLLGERGKRVLVLDRAHFPSDTLSTHFFRWPTFRILESLGVLDNVQNRAPRLSVNFNFINGHVFEEPVEGPDGPSHHLCLRRIVLDDILVTRLRGVHTVKLLEGANVRGLIEEQGRIRGVRWSHNGSVDEAIATVVVGADGFQSLVAKHVKPTAERSEPVHRAMYYGYFRGLEGRATPSAEFHYLGNRLAYVFPTDGRLTLVAASVPISEFPGYQKNAEVSFVRFLSSLPELFPRISKAGREGPIRGSGIIPGYQRVPYGRGWALVGDAAQIMDPWSGQGIDQATTHAGFLAEQLLAFLEAREDWETAMDGYHRRRNEFSTKTYERTCRAALDFRPMTTAALKKRGLMRPSL